MPLFRVESTRRVARISAGYFEIERELQRLVEASLPEIFGVRFVATEFVIGGEQPGRIDTLGLDSEGSPTIVEYKRDKNENVINQGLYCMNWLIDHKGDFIVPAQDVHRLSTWQEFLCSAAHFAGGILPTWPRPVSCSAPPSAQKRMTNACRFVG